MLIAGHGRLLAAEAMGLRAVPTIEVAGLAAAQVRALRLADNRIALGAGWDRDRLRLELGELSALDVDLDLTLTGFGAGELAALIGDGEPGDDAIPSVPVEPRTRPGDIWRLGDHRIGCGDARDRAFLREVVGGGARADAAFLDPPRRPEATADAAARTFLTDALGAAAAVSREAAVHFVCTDWRRLDAVLGAGHTVYGTPLDLCIRIKDRAGTGPFYRPRHELAFVYGVGANRDTDGLRLRPGNRTNVWEDARGVSLGRAPERSADPAARPVALVAAAIEDATRRGELVLDTFLGWGTTLIAAERCGRRCRALDADPARIDAAIARWSALTGREPEPAGRGAVP